MHGTGKDTMKLSYIYMYTYIYALPVCITWKSTALAKTP